MMSYDVEYPFSQLKSAVLILSHPLGSCSYSLVGPEKLEWPWLCTTLLSRHYKHQCVISIVFLLEPKHTWHSEEKCIPDETKTRWHLTELQGLGQSLGWHQPSSWSSSVCPIRCWSILFNFVFLAHIAWGRGNQHGWQIVLTPRGPVLVFQAY